MSTYTVTAFYYNPNISPQKEEAKRFIELEKYLKKRYKGQVGLTRGSYDFNEWNRLVEPLSLSGEGGLRCRVCYYLRLLKTFIKATKNGFNTVSSTLSISPYKNRKWLDETGMLLSEKYGIEWVVGDYSYKRSVELSKEYRLYRQTYCGCSFSIEERDRRKSQKR